MKRQELQKMKKLAGLLTEELDVSWNPFEHNYEYQSIQSSMIKTAKEYLKKAGLDPDQEYPVYTRIGFPNFRDTTSEEKEKTVDVAVKEFLDTIKTFFPTADKWISNMNYAIEEEWIRDNAKHPDDEVDMDDFDEESELIHDKDELVNKIMHDGIKSSYTPQQGIIISNITDFYKHKLYVRIITTPKEIKEDLDVSWNPYQEKKPEDVTQYVTRHEGNFYVDSWDAHTAAMDSIVEPGDKVTFVYKKKRYNAIVTDEEIGDNYLLDVETIDEDLDISWNPYDEAQQEHCLLATKSKDDNIGQNLYMNHGTIGDIKTTQKEIQGLIWREAKKLKGDGYDLYYYFNDMIDVWVFILDLSPKSNNYEKAVETISSPGGALFSSDSNQLLELCKQMIISLNPILDKNVFKWR